MSLSQYNFLKENLYHHSPLRKQSGMKYLMSLLIIVLTFCSTGAIAQSGTLVTGPLTGANALGQYYNYSNGEVVLNPGFASTPGAGQSFEAYIYTDPCAPLTLSPSADQNYVATLVPRIPITDNSQLANRSPCYVMQSIAYFDGLGRPLQTVQVNASPTLRDIVQPFVYDQFGREVTKYLPYASASANNGSYKVNPLSAQSGFYTGTADVVNTAYPYAQTLFEPSPLNRVEQQGAPGAAWQPGGRTADGGRTVLLEYTTNNNTAWSTDNVNSRQVRLFTATVNNDFSQTLATTTNYNANTLYVTVTKDENWTSGRGGTTEEYKNNSGKVVLKRTYNYNTTTSTLEKLSTYYVYDDFGNLAFVLPPKADPDNATITQAVLDNLCYQYQYDERNRLINKRVPGKGWEETIYNKLDQVVFTQDAVQRAKNERSFIKYDAMGRVIMTGIETGHTQDRAFIQNMVSGVSTLWETRSNAATGHWNSYTVNAPPSNTPNMKALVVNYYDNLNGIVGLPAYATPSGISTATTGLLTASVTAIVKDDNTYTSLAYDQNWSSMTALWKVMYYDDKGRNTATYAQHYQGGAYHINKYDLITTTYNFNDQVTGVLRKHYRNVSSNPSVLATVGTTYDYDHMGRKRKTWQAVVSNSTTLPAPVLLSQLDYNEIGQLKAKRLHSADNGTSFQQNIDYTYNERGWLLKQNAQLFEEQLQYNNVNGVAGITPIAQFNGNIASQSWGTLAAPNTKSYTYSYDQLNRLTSGISTVNFNNNEKDISYDVAGNITALKRDLNNVLVDNLTYSYMNGSDATNQLRSISDASGNNNGLKGGTYNYTYDANGNMLTDPSKNLTVLYNIFNLPRTNTISSPSASIKYTYDGAGNKLRRSVAATTTVNTDYISGIQFTGSTIDFIQTEEGRVMSITGTPNYEYSLKDHLGNTRVTFASVTGGNTATQIDDYMPFGMDIQGSVVTSPKNQYLYNGKEWQDRLNLYDYGARFYDPVIARWTSVDPKSELGRRWSPYNYGFDNPILMIDPDGMWPGPNFLSDTWNSAKSSFKGYFSNLKNTVASLPSKVEQLQTMTVGELAKTYVKTMVKMAPINMVINNVKDEVTAVKAIANGDGKSLGNVIGRQTANTVTVAATEGAGAALGRGAALLKPSASGIGDLTTTEVNSIQKVVDEAGRPLDVAGSAASGTRRGVGTNLPIGKGPGTRSDIDYLAPPSSQTYFQGLEGGLPGLDPATGIIPGSGNPYIGPYIKFEPNGRPTIVPKEN